MKVLFEGLTRSLSKISIPSRSLKSMFGLSGVLTGRRRESAANIGANERYVNALGAWVSVEGRCFTTSHPTSCPEQKTSDST